MGVLREIITFLLSGLVLAAISIILSGKLIALRFPLGFQDDSYFRIPLGIFDIRARNDEVSLGLVIFIISLTICIFVGGTSIYEYFRRQAGIDVGQWNSLCIVASFLSVIVATILCFIVPIMRSQPVIDKDDRGEALQRLEDKGQDANSI